jgi:hypothetical protein
MRDRVEGMTRALIALGMLVALTPASVGATTTKATGTSPPRVATHAKARRTTEAKAAQTAKGETTTTPPAETPTSDAPTAPAAEVMRGGSDGTVFRTLTVEGEDRVHVDFERPVLELDVKPEDAPGLDLGSARDVLDRTAPDVTGPLLATTAQAPSPYTGRPWLSQLATGAVARFRPAVQDVQRWKLTVANSKGETVTSFTGTDAPPREIAWDGRSTNGAPVVPGLTYSYVFEAWDKAGNRRNFVGNGFEVSAYRIAGAAGSTCVFSGRDLATSGNARAVAGSPSPVVLEVASWLNQTRPGPRIQVTATARTFDQASAMSAGVTRQLAALVLGDPARIQALNQVEPDAPEAGTIKVAAMP